MAALGSDSEPLAPACGLQNCRFAPPHGRMSPRVRLGARWTLWLKTRMAGGCFPAVGSAARNRMHRRGGL